jgi:hypothetical protein
MIGQLISETETLCAVIFFGVLFDLLRRRNNKKLNEYQETVEYQLYKIARVTGKSEYDVFCKSAENWPITKEKVEQDFRIYLLQQHVPYYVVDFVRKNKKHIDELHLPLF